LRVICAPRHVERAGEAAAVFAAGAGAVHRRSADLGQPFLPGDVLIWDTFGELMQAYAQATIVVMGGSFVNKGGQNPIEPASLAKPVIFGPAMENFKDIARALLEAGGAAQVPLDALGPLLTELLQDPQRRARLGANARAVIEKAAGATERTLDLLERPL